MTTSGSAGRGRLATIVAALSALLLVAALVVAGLMYARLSDDKEVDDARAGAIAAGKQFALRMDALDLSKFEDYKKSVEPLLTTKLRTTFQQQFKQFEEAYAQAKSEGDGGETDSAPGEGKIIFSAATDVDPDSATVLVAHDSVIEGQDAALHFRWQLGMRKVEGKWLVDDFTPVD